MKVTVKTDHLRRALELCGVVASSKAQEDEAQRHRSNLIFTAKPGSDVIEVAAFDRRFLSMVPLEAIFDTALEDKVVFAVELHRIKRAVDHAQASDETVIRYSEEDEKEGFAHFQYTPKRKPIPYPVFDPASYADYQTVLDRGKESFEWESETLLDALAWSKQFVVDGDKAMESHRVLEVVEDVCERPVIQGNNGVCVGFCYPPNAGGELKLRREDVNKLTSWISRSKSEGTLTVDDSTDYWIFRLDDGGVFAAKQTALRGKRFSADPLQEDVKDPEPVHVKVLKASLQATLGVVVSGMSTKTGRVRFWMKDGADEMTISAQTADGKKIFDYSMPVEPFDGSEGFEHFTECRAMLEVLPSMADEIDIFVKPGTYMRLMDKKKETVRVVLVPGMRNQSF